MSKLSNKYFLAIDMGATSGRAIVGNINNKKIELKEINRFSNPIININGRSYWNLFHLYNEILKSITIAQKENIDICI